LDESTQQRSFDSLLLPDFKQIQCVDAEQIGNEICITLDDISSAESGGAENRGEILEAHTCKFTAEWLRSNCNREVLNRQQANKATYKAWDKDSLSISSAKEQRLFERTEPLPHLRHVPTIRHEDLFSEPDAMRDALALHGISFLSGVPLEHDESGEPDLEACKNIVEGLVRKHVGFPRETIWGTLWDTAGADAYARLRVLSYADADAFIICFASNDPKSLQNIKEIWVPEIKEHCKKANPPIVIAATKCDLSDKPSLDAVMSDANTIGGEVGAVKVLPCSAKTGDGVEGVFQEIARRVEKTTAPAPAPNAGATEGGGKKCCIL